MYIEKFLNDYTEKHLAEFAKNCGLELDKYLICENYIKIRMIEPSSKIQYVYRLFDYHIEESDTGIPSMGEVAKLPNIQKEWRTYLRDKFGNQYVIHFNNWLDSQKLQFISKGKYV